MTGEQRIAQEIIANAKAEAEQTLASARGKADAIAEDARRQAEQARGLAREKAQAEGAVRADRIRRMAELDARKEELAVRRGAVNAVFDAALGELKALPAPEARALFLRLALSSAAGGEKIIAGPACAVCDAAFIDELNGRLAASGRARVSAGAPGGTAVPDDGFILAGDSSVTEISFAALMASVREGEESAIAQELGR